MYGSVTHTQALRKNNISLVQCPNQGFIHFCSFFFLRTSTSCGTTRYDLVTTSQQRKCNIVEVGQPIILQFENVLQNPIKALNFADRKCNKTIFGAMNRIQ